MPEPLKITVGPYRVHLDAEDVPLVRKNHLIVINQHDDTILIAALARALAQSRASLAEIHRLATELSQADYGCLGIPGPDFAKIAAIAAQQPAREEA